MVPKFKFDFILKWETQKAEVVEDEPKGPLKDNSWYLINDF